MTRICWVQNFKTQTRKKRIWILRSGSGQEFILIPSAGFSGAYSSGILSGYDGAEGYGSYRASSYGSSYDSSASAGYGGASGFYGKGGYINNSQYHCYAR